jgi:hypothetical protein
MAAASEQEIGNMNTKKLWAPLFAGALMFGMASVAKADPIYMDFGAGGGVDGHVDSAEDGDDDQRTETFNQLGVFANTTTTQFDTDGSGTLSEGDRFSDNGHLNVTGLIPGGDSDNEGLNAFQGYQLTAEWNGLKGTASALSDNGDGTSTGNIVYDSVGNTTFNFYVDDRTGAVGTRTNFNYGADIGSDDDVDTTFNDGVLVLSVLITGGAGSNIFDNATGAFLRGTSTLIGEVTFALEDFFFFADGADFNDLIASLIKISMFIDQNTDNVETVAGPCGDGDATTICNPGDPLFIVDSDHDGSIDFVRIPEPASVLLFGLGFLALGGITLAGRRRQQA